MAETRGRRAAPKTEEDPRLTALKQDLAKAAEKHGPDKVRLRVTLKFFFTETSKNVARHQGRTLTRPVVASEYRGRMIDRVIEAAVLSDNLDLLEVVP